MSVTVSELAAREKLEIVNMPAGYRKITGAYTGDLLSYVMSRVQNGDAWVTIMSNINVVAVATLADIACVIAAEDSDLTEDALKSALERRVNILKSSKTSYELCVMLSKYL
mgnify:CR=1 FL=1